MVGSLQVGTEGDGCWYIVMRYEWAWVVGCAYFAGTGTAMYIVQWVGIELVKAIRSRDVIRHAVGICVRGWESCGV